jgi:two-component system sensor histidine kinase DctS
MDRLTAGRPRWLLWAALVALVVALLGTLIWLAGRYEAARLQGQLELDATEAVGELRSGMSRNVQSLQTLQVNDPSPNAWAIDASSILREHRELVRLEWRDDALRIQSFVNTPFESNLFERMGRATAQTDVQQACLAAQRLSGPAYAPSYFLPTTNGMGQELMEMCLPLVSGGRRVGYLVATYSLQGLLDELAARQPLRNHELSLTEGDGTRLAVWGAQRRGSRVFSAQQLLDLPGGTTLVFKLNSWRQAPDFFPNVLTALVAAMTLALISILVLLANDMRRRQRAERDLADALAFRKAMEDSLVTGLRARDLRGRITYVNPAFCEMVGFEPAELLGHGLPAPYWPPELVDEYQQRQAIRLAGNVPPREGYESVFMRKDGTRFPVLIIEAPLINAQGVQTGWMSAFVDISEQRRVQELSRASHERLQATARLAMVGEMASLLSHELNQPLAAISSYATGSVNLLQDPADDVDSLKADLALPLQRIAEQAERAGRVIKSVHDFVRRRDQAREAVTARALLEAILPLVSLQARKLRVQVQTVVATDTPAVLCDKTMVEQVLLNLARNAMQAMEQVGDDARVLTLSVAPAPDAGGEPRVQFSVADCGPGISEAVQLQLFTPFFTTKAEGMGLGLSLCRTVVEQHGGTLEYAANLPRGTVFSFSLLAATLA